MQKETIREKVLRMLGEAPLTVEEIVSVTGHNRHRVQSVLKELHTAREIYVSGHSAGPSGWRIRQWGLGAGEDAELPRKAVRKARKKAIVLVEEALIASQDAMSVRDLAAKIGRSIEAVKESVRFLRNAGDIHQSGTYKVETCRTINGCQLYVKGALYSAGANPF